MTQYCLPVDDVIELNRFLISQNFNFIDQATLEGALAVPLQTWNGRLLYPSPLKRTAVLLERMANVHAFLDGNKRTAWVCGVVYLEQCGFNLEDVEDDDVVELMVSVAENRISVEAIAMWFAQHLV